MTIPKNPVEGTDPDIDRGIISPSERSRPSVRLGLLVLSIVVIGTLALVAAGPILWLAKSAVSTTQDILREPFAWWPSGIQWDNLVQAWNGIDVGRALANTVLIALGNWFFGLLVALTGGYALAILRPRYARVLTAMVLATLFIPSIVSLVSLYLTVIDVPLIHANLIDTFWSVWLPSAATAFNVLLVKNFFEGLPKEVFEAARVDGANALDVFWRIVLPMSKPIIGVVSLLTLVSAWKEFLWPLLVLPSAGVQPLSVVLYKAANTAETAVLIAGMFISVIIPLLLFLVFQKQFLRSAGQAGAIKG
ncbi:carbohydrate ABC transporter permease [Herbiconiux sp. 11R-BC]|uniref:carbohydrate ABC transporter permease n=1 Tax=Herbiconiux sp. 11R-BC TaxID=3111637 RepID=UPI003C0C3913